MGRKGKRERQRIEKAKDGWSEGREKKF